MRTLVLSDSHGRQELISTALEATPADRVLHCGDVEEMPISLTEAVVVRGNQDHLPLPEEALISLAGCKCLVVHGHQHGVKQSLNSLGRYGRQKKAHLVCFGHTHQPLLLAQQQRLFLNPGSLARPRGTPFPTYALLETRGPLLLVTWIRLGKPEQSHTWRFSLTRLPRHPVLYGDRRHPFFAVPT